MIPGEEVVRSRLSAERVGRRVLSIQSHVVSGYAGNKCSVFPLQLHGFEVDVINSVQFSNHTGYPGGIKGSRLRDVDLKELYAGLKTNGINHYSHILSGYCGDASFLRQIAEIIRESRLVNDKLIYICDPVLGDNGKYYVPRELTAIYLNEIIPLANIVTPNVFELGELTGTTIQTEQDCLNAVKLMHSKGVNTVVVTSGIYKNDSVMYCYASEKGSCPTEYNQYRFSIPVIKGHFVALGMSSQHYFSYGWMKPVEI